MRLAHSLAYLAAALLAACANQADSTSDTALALDSTESTEAEGNMMASAVDGAEVAALVAPTAEQVAARIAARAPQRYLPAGCATAAVEGATVKLTLADCTGPRGLRKVSGELDLTAAVDAAGVVTVHGAATGLDVNGGSLDISSDAVYTRDAEGRHLDVISHGAGIGPHGHEVTREGSYAVDWSDTCHTMSGAWQTTVGDATRSTEANVTRCIDACPTGTVKHTGLRGGTMTITFDGTATASWSASDGRSGTFALQCP